MVINRFFDLTLKPFLIIGGIATMLPALLAFYPKRFIQSLFQLEYDIAYTIIVQHWGIMVGLMGVFIFLSAFVPKIRNAILWYSTIEKSFMVLLWLYYMDQDFSKGFAVAFVTDSIIVMYSLIFFINLYMKPTQKVHSQR